MQLLRIPESTLVEEETSKESKGCKVANLACCSAVSSIETQQNLII